MIWRSTVMILVAFAVTGVVVWFAPSILNPLGLGEFAFVGQLGFAIVVLSALDAVFRRIPGSAASQAEHGMMAEEP